VGVGMIIHDINEEEVKNENLIVEENSSRMELIPLKVIASDATKTDLRDSTELKTVSLSEPLTN
jgi:hypothetical protein